VDTAHITTSNVHGLVIAHGLIHNSAVPLNLSLLTVNQTTFITKPIYPTTLTHGINTTFIQIKFMFNNTAPLMTERVKQSSPATRHGGDWGERCIAPTHY